MKVFAIIGSPFLKKELRGRQAPYIYSLTRFTKHT